MLRLNFYILNKMPLDILFRPLVNVNGRPFHSQSSQQSISRKWDNEKHWCEYLLQGLMPIATNARTHDKCWFPYCILATNTLPLYLNNSISKHFLNPFACAWCQIKEWAVSKGFSVVLSLSHNETKTIFTISTAMVQDQTPLLRKRSKKLFIHLLLLFPNFLIVPLEANLLCTWTHVCPSFSSPLPSAPQQTHLPPQSWEGLKDKLM